MFGGICFSCHNWHCFKHNRELLALRHYTSTIGKILLEIMPLNLSQTENGYLYIALVVLAIGTLVAVTVEENQTLPLSLSGSSSVVSLLDRQFHPSWAFLKSIIGQASIA